MMGEFVAAVVTAVVLIAVYFLVRWVRGPGRRSKNSLVNVATIIKNVTPSIEADTERFTLLRNTLREHQAAREQAARDRLTTPTGYGLLCGTYGDSRGDA